MPVQAAGQDADELEACALEIEKKCEEVNMLIAIASNDGETVNEHFGRAERFLIYDIAPGSSSMIDVRKVEPLSTGDRNHPLDQQRIDTLVEAIKDCRMVYCAKIGDRPRQELEKFGITAIVGNMNIQSIFAGK